MGETTVGFDDMEELTEDVTGPSELRGGDRIVLVHRKASYAATQRFPVHLVDGAGCALVDGSQRPIDFSMWQVKRLRT